MHLASQKKSQFALRLPVLVSCAIFFQGLQKISRNKLPSSYCAVHAPPKNISALKKFTLDVLKMKGKV